MPLFNRKGREPSVIGRADRAREAGQWQLAAGLYRAALDRKPRNPPIWVQYGHALKECGSRAEAEDAYRTAIAYEPKDADAHLHLGHVLKLQGKTAEAQAAYQRALALNGSLTEAARELSLLDRSEQRLHNEPPPTGAATPARGEPLTTAAIHEPATRPKFTPGKVSFISRADRARDERQWEIAAALYRVALDRNPNNSPIWVQYGHALKEAGRLGAAEGAYRTAISFNAVAAEPYLQLGHVLKMRGRRDEAQTAYLQALALKPSMTEPLHGLNSLGWPEQQTAQLTAMLARDFPDPKLGRPQPGRRAVDGAASSDIAGAHRVRAPERSQVEAPADAEIPKSARTEGTHAC
jgi:tetratricopeptide (TPR) repeat protein